MMRISGVVAGYGEREVLHGVDMEFRPGEITVLIGPNGCGKSTLLKTIVGIVECSAGEITIVDHISGGRLAEDRQTVLSVKALSDLERAKRVAYLPQSKKIPDISAFRMVLHGRFPYLNYPRKYRDEDMKIAGEALRWAGLEDKADEMVSRLSGGMQQNVYLAMALAQNADTILMDEPTTYLDVANQLRLMEMAGRLARQGKAVVMVLHDLSLALRMADRVVLMEDGRVRKTGTAEEVYDSGDLRRVFGVEIERVKTKSGWHYFWDGMVGEEDTER